MTPPLIAGVDVSTKLVAVVLLNTLAGELHETLELRTQPMRSDHPAMPRDPAYRIAAQTINKTTHAYLEAPMGKYATDVGNRALGALLAQLTIPATLYVPTAWKARAGLPGNATKDHIRLLTYQRHKNLWSNGAKVSQDLCDAAIIAYAGLRSRSDAHRLAENA